MTMTPTQLYDEFMRIAETGHEQAAEKFLNDHLSEFPEDTRNEIISTYISDTLANAAGEVRVRAEAQSAVLDALDDAKGARNEIANQQRIQDLKQQLRAK